MSAPADSPLALLHQQRRQLDLHFPPPVDDGGRVAVDRADIPAGLEDEIPEVVRHVLDAYRSRNPQVSLTVQRYLRVDGRETEAHGDAESPLPPDAELIVFSITETVVTGDTVGVCSYIVAAQHKNAD